MKLYQNLAEFYDLLYSYRAYNTEAKFLESLMNRDSSSKILDVACGTGCHLKELRKLLPDAELVGIDLNEKMLDIAKSKKIKARFYVRDMRNFDMKERFDLIYCLSSSIQYNLNESELDKSLENMRRHSRGIIVFDLAFCKERWKEGYTNITANFNNNYQVAELYTSHSHEEFSIWNPLYLIKDNKTGEIDMHVDKQTIKLWEVQEVEDFLKNRRIPYILKIGFQEGLDSVPIFVLEGLKKE